jgi:hypothetical protein
MLDILFIVLVVFVFLIGINYNKEGFETQPDDLYQTEPINTLTKKLNEYLQALITSIGTMVSTIQSNITGEVNKKIDWIKGCVGCFKFCGKEPYLCSRCCDGAPYGCNWGCTASVRGTCVAEGYRDTCRDKVDCWRTRDKCTDPIPKWNCSPSPSGFSPPNPPSWEEIRRVNC